MIYTAITAFIEERLRARHLTQFRAVYDGLALDDGLSKLRSFPALIVYPLSESPLRPRTDGNTAQHLAEVFAVMIATRQNDSLKPLYDEAITIFENAKINGMTRPQYQGGRLVQHEYTLWELRFSTISEA